MACYLTKGLDKIIYCHIENQHPDSMRFLLDCELALGREIEILQSRYKNVQSVIEQFRYVNGPYGAKCTEVLKKKSAQRLGKAADRTLNLYLGV